MGRAASLSPGGVKDVAKLNLRFAYLNRCLSYARWALAAICIFVLAAPCAHAQTFSVLYTFTGGVDGSGLFSAVAINKAGTTLYGGDCFTGEQPTTSRSPLSKVNRSIHLW